MRHGCPTVCASSHSRHEYAIWLAANQQPSGLVNHRVAFASKTIAVLACAAYAGLLQWSFYSVEVTVGYTAIRESDVGRSTLVASFAFVVAIAAMLPSEIKRPSHVALWILYLTWYVPCALFAYHVGNLPDTEVFELVVYSTAAFVILIPLCTLRPITIPAIRVSHAAFVAVLTGATVLLAALALSFVPDTHAGNLGSLFALNDVYIRRLQSREVVTGGSLVGYALANLASALAPLSLVYGITRRRPLIASIGMSGHLSVFMLDGTKLNLFVPVLIITILLLLSKARAHFGNLCALGLSILIGMSVYTFHAHESLWLSTNVVRRAVVSRGTTIGAYFETFRNNPVYLRDSSIAALVGERAEAKATTIGRDYALNHEAHWNAGAWASMLGDFGVPGLFVATAAIAAILLLYDGLTARAPFAIVATMAGVLAYTWGDAAVTSSLLTHGAALTLILLTHYGTSDQRAISGVNAPPYLHQRRVRPLVNERQSM